MDLILGIPKELVDGWTFGPDGDDYKNSTLRVGYASAQTDAFGRLRVSGTGHRLDTEFIYDKQAEFFDEVTNNGTVTHNSNGRDLTLSISDANSGTHATMSSYPVPYTPGNSQLIDITGTLDLAAIGGGNAEIFLRSSVTGSVVEQVVTQDNWIADTTGVDWSASHIFQIDFQSLKVGRIRYAMVTDGTPVCIATIENDNIRSGGYWQSPTLPAYWKIYNDATYTYMEMGYGNDENGVGFRYKMPVNATATMCAICTTVKSEGGNNLSEVLGLSRSADNAITPITVSSTLVPLLSIRPKSLFNTFDNLILTLPKTFSISNNNPIKLVIVHSPTLTGALWVDVDSTESSVEYDVSATAISNGHEVYSEYITTSSKNKGASSQGLLGKTVLWNRLGSESGILTIAAIRTSGTDASCLAAIQWEELR